MSVAARQVPLGLLPCLLVAALAAGGPAHAGAWTAARGASYHKLSLNYFTSNTAFDDSHHEQPFEFDGRFTERSLTYYGEYGILDRLTIFGTLPLKSIHYKNILEQGTTNGIADIDVGLRVKLGAPGPFVFSFQGLAKVPGGYDGANRLPLGNDQIDIEARFLAGASALHGRIYFGGEVAYRVRFEAPSDEWRFLVEIGGNFTAKFYGRLKVDEVRSVGNQDDVRDVFGNPLLQLSPELRRAELTLGARFSKRWSGEAIWAPIFYGTNVAKGSTFSLAAVCAF